jgi:glycosyltransferase involved in cell wall biosynthesis
MTEFPTESLLRLENACLPRATGGGARSLLLSLNPDLVKDFGHFLNYEKRIREVCVEAGITYRCLASSRLAIQDPDLLPTFKHDSGHFSLVRRGAAGEESALARQLFEAVRDALARLDPDRQFDRVWVFLYCGSSLLAARLVEFEWDARVRVCINAFWDFLLPDRLYSHVAVLPFQRQVRLLAMSDLHRDEILDASGLGFDPIPNPPPLLRDVQSYNEIHAQADGVWRQRGLQVFVPGLMTMGKGQDATRELFRHLCGVGVPDGRFVFRDRQGTLGSGTPVGVSVVTSDLSDDEVADLYRDSDFVLLPYEPGTFGVRTSGALVDCLMFGAVPLVLSGTWLAHVCERLGVGHVLPDMKPSTVLRCIDDAVARLPAERVRVLQAAGRYLVRHHWGKLVDIVTQDPDAGLAAPPPMALQSAPSALAVANRLFRDGRIDDAARIYRWLQQGSSLKIYERNLQLCERRHPIS